MTPAMRDVWVRAGKTSVQALVSSAAIAYARYQANPHGTLLWPGVLAGLAAAGAGGASVLWNGGTTLRSTRKAAKVAAFYKAVEDAIEADRRLRPYQDGHPSTP